MTPEFVAIILGFITLIFTVVNSNNQLRKELKDAIEKLEFKQDENFKMLLARIDKVQSELSIRIDAVNNRLDNLYQELFRKAA